MTSDRALLSKVLVKAELVVIFGDGIIVVMGNGCLKIDNFIIEDISQVEGLAHNLLSTIQFYKKLCEALFKKEK